MKVLFFLLYLIFFNGQNAYASPAGNEPDTDIFSLTEEMLLAHSEKNETLQQDFRDRLSLLDINDDGFVSDTEIKGMIQGLDAIPNMTEKEKKEITAATEKIFNESDTDHDHLLNKTEMEAFTKKFSVIMIKLEFKKKDINGDGVIDLKDIPPVEDSMKKLDEAIKKLDDFSNKMKSMSGEEMAQNFIKNTGAAIAKEDFYRMDKDNNGCVSANEYADYQLKQQQKMMAEEKEEDQTYLLTREDFQSLYAETKKSKPECLTLDEYVAQQSSFLDRGKDKTPEQRNAEFDLMDKNKDGKLTAEEFAAYKMKTASDNDTTKEEFVEMFNLSPEAEKNGYLTKEEFARDGYLFDF